jgi:hypothetical protein
VVVMRPTLDPGRFARRRTSYRRRQLVLTASHPHDLTVRPRWFRGSLRSHLNHRDRWLRCEAR